MTRRDHLDHRLAEQMETVLSDLATSERRAAAGPARPSLDRIRLIVAFAIVLALLIPASLLAFSNHPRRGAPAATEVPVRITPTLATIGALPKRRSLSIHGTGNLEPLDAETKKELRNLARDSHEHADVVLRNYATEPAFTAVMHVVGSSPGFVDAVYHPGRKAASILRFAGRPQDSLLTTLREQYPGDLRIEWGARLIGDRQGGLLSSNVFSVIDGVPGTDGVLTGIDGDERLNASYRGTASLQSVVRALLDSAALRTFFVEGQPPTEIRISKGPAQEAATPTATTKPGEVRVIVATKTATAVAGVGTNGGKLAVSSHHCLSLNGRTIVAPPGSSYANQTLTIPGHGSIALGGQIDPTDITPVDNSASFRQYLPADVGQCGTGGFIWMYPMG